MTKSEVVMANRILSAVALMFEMRHSGRFPGDGNITVRDMLSFFSDAELRDIFGETEPIYVGNLINGGFVSLAERRMVKVDMPQSGYVSVVSITDSGLTCIADHSPIPVEVIDAVGSYDDGFLRDGF